MTKHSRDSEPMSHPGWCDPRSCNYQRGIFEHVSESVELDFAEVTFTFALVSTGDGTAQVWMHLEHARCESESVTVLLDPEFDVPALIARLDTERNQAKYLSAPVFSAVAS